MENIEGVIKQHYPNNFGILSLFIVSVVLGVLFFPFHPIIFFFLFSFISIYYTPNIAIFLVGNKIASGKLFVVGLKYIAIYFLISIVGYVIINNLPALLSGFKFNELDEASKYLRQLTVFPLVHEVRARQLAEAGRFGVISEYNVVSYLSLYIPLIYPIFKPQSTVTFVVMLNILGQIVARKYRLKEIQEWWQNPYFWIVFMGFSFVFAIRSISRPEMKQNLSLFYTKASVFIGFFFWGLFLGIFMPSYVQDEIIEKLDKQILHVKQ